MERPSPNQLTEIYRQMILIRTFDASLQELYTRGLIRGSSHSAIGQEAVAVGACAALKSDDYITSTHRGHGHTIAKGADIRRMAAELMGRASGLCRGKGGSMHIADFEIGMLGANGIVGGGLGIAAGAALSCQLRGSQQIALCFFGDGAINQGAFHGVANIASIWQLPLVLLCENNHFAMSARVEQMTAIENLEERASSYSFPGVGVDGTDPVAVRNAVGEAVERARTGLGPTLVVASCYRFEGHFGGDLMNYRSAEEAQPWLDRDPVKLFRQRLLDTEILDESRAARLEEDARGLVQDAFAWAEHQPEPEASEAWDDIYA